MCRASESFALEKFCDRVTEEGVRLDDQHQSGRSSSPDILEFPCEAIVINLGEFQPVHLGEGDAVEVHQELSEKLHG